MTSSKLAILWIYAAIVAIWPIRIVVLEIVIRRQQVLSPTSPRLVAVPEPRPGLGDLRPRTRS